MINRNVNIHFHPTSVTEMCIPATHHRYTHHYVGVSICPAATITAYIRSRALRSAVYMLSMQFVECFVAVTKRKHVSIPAEENSEAAHRETNITTTRWHGFAISQRKSGRLTTSDACAVPRQVDEKATLDCNNNRVL